MATKTVQKFPCPEHGCSKSFTRKAALEAHLHGQQHANEKRFQCSQCTARFVRKDDCRKHEERMHQGIARFVCASNHCNLAYPTKYELNRHLDHFPHHDQSLSQRMCLDEIPIPQPPRETSSLTLAATSGARPSHFSPTSDLASSDNALNNEEVLVGQLSNRSSRAQEPATLMAVDEGALEYLLELGIGIKVDLPNIPDQDDFAGQLAAERPPQLPSIAQQFFNVDTALYELFVGTTDEFREAFREITGIGAGSHEVANDPPPVLARIFSDPDGEGSQVDHEWVSLLDEDVILEQVIKSIQRWWHVLGDANVEIDLVELYAKLTNHVRRIRKLTAGALEKVVWTLVVKVIREAVRKYDRLMDEIFIPLSHSGTHTCEAVLDSTKEVLRLTHIWHGFAYTTGEDAQRAELENRTTVQRSQQFQGLGVQGFARTALTLEWLQTSLKDALAARHFCKSIKSGHTHSVFETVRTVSCHVEESIYELGHVR